MAKEKHLAYIWIVFKFDEAYSYIDIFVTVVLQVCG